MALAKYHEEIEERWIASTNDRYESLLANVFDQFPARPLSAGEVHLTRSGRRMEDIEVCESGQSLELAVVSTPGAAEPKVEIEGDSTRQFLKPNARGTIKFSLRKSGSMRLHVSSHGFLKTYTIHAVEPFSAEDLPDFAKLIHSLGENPPQWTESSFSAFRDKLEVILQKNSLPPMFSEGIIDYHLGLFHEEQRLPSFRERFQAAYGSLRWFIPYSDIARLICAYYLYCSNEFAASQKLFEGRCTRLGRVNSFFLERDGEALPSGQSGPKKRAALPLLVACPDLLTFQVVEALDAGRTDDADELIAIAGSHTQADFDGERAARIAFLRARVRNALGDSAASRSMFESLQHSPWQAIATASANHLS